MSVLATHLAGSTAPLGRLIAEGHDALTLCAETSDPAILDAALKRAGLTQDRYWQIALATRRLEIARDDQTLAQLVQWLIEAGQADTALALLGPAPRWRREPLAQAYLRRRCLVETGDFEQADALMQRTEPGPGEQAAYCAALMARGRWGRAEAAVATLRSTHPDNPLTALAEVRLAALMEGPKAATERLAEAPALVGNPRLIAAETAQLLLERGRFWEAFDHVAAALHRDPTQSQLYWMAEAAALQSDRAQDLGRLIDQLERLFGAQSDVLALRCNHAADIGEFDLVTKLLPRLRERSEWRYHEARIGALCQQGERAAVEAAFADALSCGMPDIAARLTLANYYYYYQGTPDGLARAGALIAPLDGRMEDDSGLQRLRLRLRLAAGDRAGCRSTFAALPAGLCQSAALKPFELMFAAEDGAQDAARAGWSRALAENGHIALNARSARPVTELLRYRESPGDVLLFSVIFNGIEFVDWFLETYRALGVDHFFIIDNGSTDGTFEALLKAPDVSLFRQTGSFRDAGCGVAWINHLMRRFGVGHWCFHVDMDEAFVFPHMETGRSLRQFLAYLDQSGAESVPALMIDIYPEQLAPPATAQDAFAQSRYIDTDYRSFACEIPPYRFDQGGLRARLSGRSLMMTKAPLVKMRPDLAYIANNHQHTHARIADVSAALLHYKFIGDLMSRVDEAIDRGEHFMAARFYRALRVPLQGATTASTLLTSEHSHAYTGPADLLSLGLITSSDLWDSCHN